MPDKYSGMDGLCAFEFGHLMPAGSAGRDQNIARFHLADGRQQAPFGDRDRNIVVTARIAERSGHAAAAGVEIDDLRAGNSRQQRDGGGQQAHGFLMTMAVQENACPGRRAAAGRASRQIRRRAGRPPRRCARFLLQFAPQQADSVVFDRRKAAGFAEQNRFAALGDGIQGIDQRCRMGARFAAAAPARSADVRSSRGGPHSPCSPRAPEPPPPRCRSPGRSDW